MHVNLTLLLLGLASAVFGGSNMFSPSAAAYIDKISLDKYLISPEFAVYSRTYIDGAFALGLGLTLILAAFLY